MDGLLHHGRELGGVLEEGHLFADVGVLYMVGLDGLKCLPT